MLNQFTEKFLRGRPSALQTWKCFLVSMAFVSSMINQFWDGIFTMKDVENMRWEGWG